MEMRLGQRIDSLKSLLDDDYDAIFVGCGAPRGRDLPIPGRHEAAANIHIGIDWLSSVSFGHIDQHRQARDRAGWRQYSDGLLPFVAPAGRRGREGHRPVRLRGDEGVALGKGQDAMHEDIPILNMLVPKEFTHKDGKLTGVMFEKVKAERDAKGRRRLVPTGEPDQHFECDDVLVAVGQENAFPWIERDIGIEFDQWDMPVVDEVTMGSTHPKIFFGGDAAFGPKNIIWAVAHGHQAAISIHQLLPGRKRPRSAAAAGQSDVAEDGHPRVELRQRHLARPALQGAAPRQGDRAARHQGRGGAGIRSTSWHSPRRSAA